jgi:hypothetical protein
MSLYLVNAVLAFLAAIGFWVGRTILQKSVSSQVPWFLGLGVAFTMTVNCLITLFVSVCLIKNNSVGLGFAGVFYCTTPLLLDVLGPRFDDRRWVLPLISLIFLVGAGVNLHLANLF